MIDWEIDQTTKEFLTLLKLLLQISRFFKCNESVYAKLRMKRFSNNMVRNFIIQNKNSYSIEPVHLIKNYKNTLGPLVWIAFKPIIEFKIELLVHLAFEILHFTDNGSLNETIKKIYFEINLNIFVTKKEAKN